MATEKNITMKEFNGTDYDILYPKTIATQIPDVYSKTEILTTETLAKYGLTADKLPNDVFQQIKTLIDNTQSNIESRAKIQIGSYIGTGTYGASNPCSLTFNFKPEYIQFIISNSYTIPVYVNNSIQIATGVWTKLLTTTYEIGLGETQWGSFATLNKMVGNTIYWYTAGNNASYQFNSSNVTYNYIAIG